MIIELNDKKIEESIKHLKKAIEIAGGNTYLGENNTDEALVSKIVREIFEKGNIEIKLADKNYTIDELFKLKTEFEKYFLKNKIKMVRRIVDKVKRYNTELEGQIRRFKKDNSIETLREITNEIEKRYKWEFDEFLLVNIENKSEDINYYGDYLNEKKKQLIDSILMKLGI